MIIAGMDPGKTGAVVLLFDNNETIVLRIPLAGREPMWGQWADTWAALLQWSVPDSVVGEDVSARPKQGVTGMFKFGEVLGYSHGLLRMAAPQASFHWVTPSVWKRKMGLLGLDKKASFALAGDLMPTLKPEIKRVKDDGVAEAALIAYYGRKYLC